MKTIQRFVHWLYASHKHTKIPEPSAPEYTGPPLVQVPLAPKPEPFIDDESPPGFKIRWHF